MATGASAAAAIAQAIKAFGIVVFVEPQDFQMILARSQTPLVVVSQGKILKNSYKYITSYKGLAFYTKSKQPIQIDSTAEIVTAKQIWIPG